MSNRKTMAVRAKEGIWKALIAHKKATGEEPWDKLIELAVFPSDGRVSVPAWRIIIEALTSGESSQDITVTTKQGPSIYLPERKPLGAPVDLKSVK